MAQPPPFKSPTPPIRLFQTVTETKGILIDETKMIKEQTEQLETPQMPPMNGSVDGEHDMHLTMVEREVRKNPTDTASTLRCYIRNTALTQSLGPNNLSFRCLFLFQFRFSGDNESLFTECFSVGRTLRE